MQETHLAKIASEANLDGRKVRAVAELLADGSTVPFIARYRKEVTGGLDEVEIITVRDRLEQLAELDKRREAIVKSLQEQGKYSDELKAKVGSAETLSALEDIYLPFRPKRRTRGMIAKERGLEPLATLIFDQGPDDVNEAAKRFVDVEKEVPTAADALAGARDLIAEWVNEDADVRAEMRELFEDHGMLSSKVLKTKAEEAGAAKYKDYFDWSEPISEAPSHRVLAIRRGAKEGFLVFHILPDEDAAMQILTGRFIKGTSSASEQVGIALQDCYKRLLSLSMETELRLSSRKKADIEAIQVFADNLRELLLAAPLGQKSVMALDPGFRTGCKVVCMDRQGKLLHHDTIYPLEPQRETQEAEGKLRMLADRYEIEAIAVGNGTGGREAHAFCKSIDFGGRVVQSVMVNESGASIYSASEVAREEFGEYDLTVRGSVSIGRRLCDPLSELVKIDPKSIGVGQYQHDVDQRQLKTSLDDVVSSCVNAVGVEANTASKQLLSYVSGLSERLAGNIVGHRNENGPFVSRKDFLKVQGMGPKTFEQAAGFLRIREGANPLDASAVHPERYETVELMASNLGCSVGDLIGKAELRSQLSLKEYVTDTVGLPTLTDIMSELDKPGRDPRETFEIFTYAEGVNEMSDLEVGMKLPGVVTNVTAFGAFVDVGVHQDGLVHISQIADRFVENPSDVLKVQQKVEVTVIGVDLDRARISLSMRSNPDAVDAGKGGERGKTGTQSRRSGGRRKSRDDRSKQCAKNEVDLSNNPFVDFFKNSKFGQN